MADTNFTGRLQSTQPAWLTILRILLGLILTLKAYVFIKDTATAKMLIEYTGIGVFSRNSEILALVITYLGLLCGLFILLGLYTRIASLVQIPVLVVAVFFVNIKKLDDSIFELLLSVLTLGLLILFSIKGSGRFSLDEYFRKGEIQDKAFRESPSH